MFRKRKIIDLTLPLKNNPPKFLKKEDKTIEKDGWNASMLHIYSHYGTHMDAPVHFNVSNQSIDQLKTQQFIVNCYIVRLETIQPHALITTNDLGPVKKKIKPGQGILFHTGWSKYAENPGMYRDQLPRISQELAQWCARKKVSFIGVEPPSVADVNNIKELTEIHTILLRHNIIIVEGLTNLEKISKKRVQIIALPLKIQEGDGAPARVIAIE
ncbi:MAG: cyclase family protein [Bacteroidetes bacterium]|jgi:kynurenine formamidase|nr:cyclase family protein [Bacteroidota bacterium]